MPARSLIAFTGGLDSTYVLHEELKKGNDVEVVYVYVTQYESQRLAEITSRRRILNHFRTLYPDQIKDEWIVVSTAMQVKQGPSSRRQQLVQQYNTVNALIQVIVQSEQNYYYRPMTGWHHLDVFENSPDEYQSEETYDLYKQIFKGLVRSIDVERTVMCNLLTPAYDVDKLVMWHSLDEWTQANISTGYRYDQDQLRNGAVVLSDDSRLSGKSHEYRTAGIPVVCGTIAHYDLLTPLDRYFLGVYAGNSDGFADIFNRCKYYFKGMPFCSASAINLDTMTRIFNSYKPKETTREVSIV